MAKGLGDVTKFLTAGIGASFVDGLVVNPLLARAGLNISDDIGRLGVGMLGRNFFKNAMLKNAFEAMAIVGSFQLGGRLASGLFQTTTATTTTNGRLF